jgi:hypothetical protein
MHLSEHHAAGPGQIGHLEAGARNHMIRRFLTYIIILSPDRVYSLAA